MGVVMITCPNTDRAVNTGIEIDPHTFASFQTSYGARNVRIAEWSTSGGLVRLGLGDEITGRHEVSWEEIAVGARDPACRAWFSSRAIVGDFLERLLVAFGAGLRHDLDDIVSTLTSSSVATGALAKLSFMALSS